MVPPSNEIQIRQMSTPAQQHNALLAVGELMKIMIDEERYPDLPEKIRLSVKALIRDYPDRSVIDSLYEGQTYGEVPEDDSDITEEERESNDRFYNNNQTWDTPGYKWKTQVEFSPAEDA